MAEPPGISLENIELYPDTDSEGGDEGDRPSPYTHDDDNVFHTASSAAAAASAAVASEENEEISNKQAAVKVATGVLVEMEAAPLADDDPQGSQRSMGWGSVYSPSARLVVTPPAPQDRKNLDTVPRDGKAPPPPSTRAASLPNSSAGLAGGGHRASLPVASGSEPGSRLRNKMQCQEVTPDMLLSSRDVRVVPPATAAAGDSNVPAPPRTNNAQSKASPTHSGTTDEASQSKAMTTLLDDGFPLGLADQMVHIQEKYPIRWWVVDNSGSMMTADCRRLVEGRLSRFASPRCTRWDELKDTVKYHVRLAGMLKAKTTFRLLNNPGSSVGPQEFTIKRDGDVDAANDIMDKLEPDGVTPLTHHIIEITKRITKIEDDLIASGKKAVVVIATDGLPSDRFGKSGDAVKHEFSMALKALEAKPVWLIARLCTNDKTVVNFWSKLDCELELSIESIDDYINEAKEVQSKNKWLNYGMPLHRSREFGFRHKVFDLLDERSLTKDELLMFFKQMFGEAKLQGAPDIHTDWKAFAAFLSDVVTKERQQWCPATNKLDYWIDVKKLTQVYGGGGLLGMVRKSVSDFTG